MCYRPTSYTDALDLLNLLTVSTDVLHLHVLVLAKPSGYRDELYLPAKQMSYIYQLHGCVRPTRYTDVLDLPASRMS